MTHFPWFVGKLRVMAAVLAFLGLLVGADGLLHGPWWRTVAGWAWFGAWTYIAIRGLPDFIVSAAVAEEVVG